MGREGVEGKNIENTMEHKKTKTLLCQQKSRIIKQRQQATETLLQDKQFEAKGGKGGTNALI